MARLLFWVLSLLSCSAVATAQTLPTEIYTLLAEAGVEYVEPSADLYNYYPGKDYSWFSYDFKLSKAGHDVYVNIQPITGYKPPHLGMARLLANATVDADRCDIDILWHRQEGVDDRGQEFMLQSHLRPRGFFRRARGKIVTFYTDNGSVVTLSYMYDQELAEDKLLVVKKLN